MHAYHSCYHKKTTTTTTKKDMPTSTLLRTISPTRLQNLLLILSLVFIAYLLLSNHHHALYQTPPIPFSRTTLFPTTRRHLFFSIASSSLSFRRRKPYLRLWYSPGTTRAVAYIDKPPSDHSSSSSDDDVELPPTVVSEDTSQFPYTFRGGLRSAIRVARVVKEAVERDEPDVRWYVFGDDDTVFIVDNLVKVLSKYDHDKWYYIGSSSESYEQNEKNSFDMAFGGAGFVISSSLARALARVLDSCLVRYPHLYGSDYRVFSCIAELGIGLTREPGFHQVDMRGSLLGLLTAHPLSPIVSLHHLDAMDPIFPGMNRTQAIEHLFEAVNVDSFRILQQSVCYDRSNSLTVSVSWGYAIQVYEGNVLLPDLLSVQRTFTPWRRSISIASSHYMFNLRESPRDRCKGPLIFYMDGVVSDENGVKSKYVLHRTGNCARGNAVRNMRKISVFTRKLEYSTEQMKVVRRDCCDILPIVNGSMVISIRRCGVTELISMQS